ncbi:adenylate kinase [Collinsella sp. An2]|uniref:adenylate kinase n=1 Tax=Collinsella sp. An2 TaxID=1965585 RepID=UPI000B3788C3|nr:adenylate kinase [Collinsella sp. An2]OUP07191.1 adenylate kinase [Collinsella sp. An2]
MNIVLLGGPGAGKGTMAQRLVADFGVAHISTGDLLRAAVKGGTELGMQAKKYMDAGELVPDQLVIDLVKERLADDDAQEGFILDGFPRNTVQAVTLDSELSAMGRTIDCALLIDVAPEVIVERLSGRRTCRACGYTGTAADAVCPKCGGEMYQRDDDKPETIKNRLDVYEKSTSPLVEYYRGQGLLKTVDGAQAIDEVYAAVKEALGL